MFSRAVKPRAYSAVRGIPRPDISSAWPPDLEHQDRICRHAAAVCGCRTAERVRRTFDVAFSLALLFAMLPVLALAGCLIKLDSPGPLFYRQERVGLDNAVFWLLKLRSMRVDAEADGPRWATRSDPRVTRTGRWLRLSRIDELPQLLNVLQGSMSLVGPRPERPFFVEQLERAIPHFGERVNVKPGITGWAQVNHPYGASVEDAREKLAYDLHYIEHRTLLMDLFILLSTARVILTFAGAR